MSYATRLGITLTAVVALAGCSTMTRVSFDERERVLGGGPAVVVRSRRGDALERRVRHDLRRAEVWLRDRVSFGDLAPEALDFLTYGASKVFAALRLATRDGVVTDQETAEVETLTRDVIVQSAQCLRVPRAWPGGSQYWR